MDETSYRNCFAMKLICKKGGKIRHVKHTCQSKMSSQQDKQIFTQAKGSEVLIPFMELCQESQPVQGTSSEEISKPARCFNDIFIFGGLIQINDAEDLSTIIPMVKLKITGKAYKCIPNTTYGKCLMSMSQLMQIGDISKLKPQNNTIKLLNGTDLHLIGSIE